MAELNAKAIQYTGGTNQAGGYTLKPEAYYDKLLLKMLRQMEFHYAKYAVEKSLPKNFGDTINWRRFNKLSVTKAPLIEGVTPDGQTVSGSEITAVIAQYGNVMYFTDVIDLQQLDKIRQEYTVELGFQAKETMDEIVRDVLVAEGSTAFGHASDEVFTTNSSIAVLAAGDIPRIDDFRKIVMAMKKGYIQGNRKAGGKYVALISPDVMAQLFEDDKVQNYMDFGRTNAMFADGMVVDLFGIRFEEVLNAPVVGIAHDSIIIGEEAYAITKLEGAGVRVITKGLGSAGVEDPLDQRQSIGWKITGFSAAVLNADAVVNYWSVPAFDTDTDDFDPALGFVTLTFALHDANVSGTIVRGAVKLPKGQSYTYADFIALAGWTGAATNFALSADGATSATLTDVLTADDVVYLSDTVAT
jgi:N4-gp56 family major capsid protein